MYGHIAYRPRISPRSPSRSELEPGRQRQVPATALAGDHDVAGVDAQLGGAGRRRSCRPDTQSFEPGRERRHLGRRRRRHAVAEVDHRHGHALGGDDAAPGPVHAVEARHRWPCRRRGCSTRTAATSSVCGRMNCTLIVLPSGADVNSSVLTSRPFDGATSSLSSSSNMAVICSRWATASGRLTSSSSAARLVDVSLRRRGQVAQHRLDPGVDAGVVGESAHGVLLGTSVGNVQRTRRPPRSRRTGIHGRRPPHLAAIGVCSAEGVDERTARQRLLETVGEVAHLHRAGGRLLGADDGDDGLRRSRLTRIRAPSDPSTSRRGRSPAASSSSVSARAGESWSAPTGARPPGRAPTRPGNRPW